MPTIAVLGTMDTKGEEHAFLAQRIHDGGATTIVIDAGVMGTKAIRADVTPEEVAEAGGTSLADLRQRGDRGHAIEVMSRGAAAVLQRLHERGAVDGVVTLAGGGGSTLAASAMRPLPVGFPKLIVSTLASGDTRPLVRGRDITLMYSVLDIAGLNRVSRQIIENAAGAIVGMATARRETTLADERPLIGASMFGVTTTAVQAARTRLEQHGYGVLVFAAVGSGGEALEALIRSGQLVGVLDLTTTELVDDLVGGVMSAGPERLTAAAESGVPQAVSVGAMDMANLGPLAGVAPRFRDRKLVEHVETMMLMRTSVQENQELGRRLAERVSASTAPAAVFLPMKGVSAIATEGGPFHDSAADGALFAAVHQYAEPPVEVHELDLGANDEAFGEAMADWLIRAIEVTNNESRNGDHT